MIVETSALVAILKGEPEAPKFIAAILQSGHPRMSAATYVELINVVDRRLGQPGLAVLDKFMDAAGIRLVAFTEDQARWARHARLTYGAGRHKANLNFGDCFSYAL